MTPYQSYLEKSAIVAPRIADSHFVPKMHASQAAASWGKVDHLMNHLGFSPDAVAHPELHTPHLTMTPVAESKPDLAPKPELAPKAAGLGAFADDALRLLPAAQSQPPKQPNGQPNGMGTNWQNPHQRYMKMATRFQEAAVGGALGAGAAYALPPDGNFNRTAGETRRDSFLTGGLAAALAPLVMDEARKLAAGLWPFEGGQPSSNLGMQGDIYAARAKLSRVKLTLGNSFKKLSPDEQKTLLGSHDKYHKLVETSIRSGALPGGF